jgi:hypothetical protein
MDVRCTALNISQLRFIQPIFECVRLLTYSSEIETKKYV